MKRGETEEQSRSSEEIEKDTTSTEFETITEREKQVAKSAEIGESSDMNKCREIARQLYSFINIFFSRMILPSYSSFNIERIERDRHLFETLTSYAKSKENTKSNKHSFWLSLAAAISIPFECRQINQICGTNLLIRDCYSYWSEREQSNRIWL